MSNSPLKFNVPADVGKQKTKTKKGNKQIKELHHMTNQLKEL